MFFVRMYEGKKINCLGDSITEGVNTSKPYHEWLYDMNGFSKVNNYGIRSTCISTGEDNNFIKRYPFMDKDADVISVLGGTNDWGHSHKLGNISSRDTDTFYGALKVLCDGLINRYLTKTIFFITPLQRVKPADGCPIGQKTNLNGNTLLQYVQAIQEVCASYSIPVLNLYDNCFCPSIDKVKTNIMQDGLHPNEVGHKIMARKIASFINTL